MATLTKGSPLGDYNGKIGGVVLVDLKEHKVAKSTPIINKNRIVSDEQLKQRAVFKAAAEFIFKIPKSVIDRAYQLGRKENKTAHNVALSYHMLKAVRWVDNKYILSLPDMKFSRPLLEIENGWKLDFYKDVEGNLVVKGGMNPFPDKFTHSDDEATVIFYNTSLNKFLCFSELRRDSLNFEFKYYKDYVGLEFFCWIFFMSADTKRVSATKYLGVLNR